MKALENPRRSIHDYGTVGCTKDPVGRGKQLIIADCITEDGLVPGALWTFSTHTTKEKSSHQLFVNKSKKDDEMEVGDKKHEEEAGILEDFDYHDNINTESYEKYFENVCKLLKPNSVKIIDNASYHARNADDFPVSKWKDLSFKIG